MKIVKQSVEVINATPNIGETIEFHTRMCYKSHNLVKEGSAEKLFNQIVKQFHHDSVTESANVTFHITTDRATQNQLVRHRIGTCYSVESQRYCSYNKGKFGNEVTFIKPHDIKEGTEAYRIWEHACINAERSYFELLENKVRPESARFVLPNSTKCEMAVTMNIRALRHFFKLRADGHAQSDIQELCKLMHEAMMKMGIPAYLFDDVIGGE